MFSILNRALSWAITIFGNKFCLKKMSRLMKALDSRFYVKFMQLEVGCCLKFIFSQAEDPNFETFLGEHALNGLAEL